MCIEYFLCDFQSAFLDSIKLFILHILCNSVVNVSIKERQVWCCKISSLTKILCANDNLGKLKDFSIDLQCIIESITLFQVDVNAFVNSWKQNHVRVELGIKLLPKGPGAV